MGAAGLVYWPLFYDYSRTATASGEGGVNWQLNCRGAPISGVFSGDRGWSEAWTYLHILDHSQ